MPGPANGTTGDDVNSISVDPASLPEIDEVDVVELGGFDPPQVGDFIRRADRRSLRVGGLAAQNIAALWRSLPPGEMTRCHTPPFGLRFLSRGSVIVEASLCWGCNNAFGFMGEQRISFVFDGGADESRTLLALLDSVIPGRTGE